MDTQFLTTEQIIEGIEYGMSAGANYIAESKLKRAIERIRNQKLELNQDSEEVASFKTLISEGLGLFATDAIQQFQDCELYILPQEICISHSRLIGERKVIVISSGMLNLMYSMANWTHIVERLPEELDKEHPFSQWPTVGTKSGLSVLSFLLISRGYQFAEGFPSFGKLRDDNSNRLIKNSMASSALFLLFHEVGHLSLDHLTKGEVKPVVSHSILEEEYSLYKRKELEADWFVYQSLQLQAKKVFQTMIVMGLNFYSLFENILSAAGETHPLTLNRIFHANKNFEQGLLDKPLMDIHPHITRQASGYKNIKEKNSTLLSDSKKNLFHQLKRAEILENLALLTPLLKGLDIDISSILNGAEEKWENVLTL